MSVVMFEHFTYSSTVWIVNCTTFRPWRSLSGTRFLFCTWQRPSWSKSCIIYNPYCAMWNAWTSLLTCKRQIKYYTTYSHPLSPLPILWLTCVSALHAEQNNDEDSQDDEEDHYDNGYYHTNYDSSVHRGWGLCRWSWRKEHTHGNRLTDTCNNVFSNTDTPARVHMYWRRYMKLKVTDTCNNQPGMVTCWGTDVVEPCWLVTVTVTG